MQHVLVFSTFICIFALARYQLLALRKYNKFGTKIAEGGKVMPQYINLKTERFDNICNRERNIATKHYYDFVLLHFGTVLATAQRCMYLTINIGINTPWGPDICRPLGVRPEGVLPPCQIDNNVCNARKSCPPW